MDKRFLKITEDPRFKVVPKDERKLKVDSRFQHMFTDDNFLTKFTSDKRGRKLRENNIDDFTSFYEIPSTEEKDEVPSKPKKREKEVSNKKKTKLQKREKDIGNIVKSKLKDIHEIQNKDVEDDADDDESDNDIVHSWGNIDEDAPRIEDAETCRIAVCNCDWDKVDASDIYVLMNSFKPDNGTINSVKVYPSDFGKERMKEEDLNGPQELKLGDMENSEDAKLQMEKLREYQLKRLKYYYAVVECDCTDTANKIYEDCDGMEFEMSSTRLDIRFIPEDLQFSDVPKSQCDGSFVLQNYEPVNFLNTALQQTKVRLTWDESEEKRLKTTTKKFSEKELKDMDFKDLIASSSEDENEELSENNSSQLESNNVNNIEKYKRLVNDIDDEMDEVNGDDEEETIEWRDVSSSDDEIHHQHNEKEQNSKSKTNKKNKRKKRKFMENADDEVDKNEKNELELLVHDDEDDRNHFNLTDLLKKENSGKKSKKNKKQKIEVEDSFDLDLKDKRFGAVYSSSLFNIDPSSQNFKNTAGTKAIMSELQKQREKAETKLKSNNKVDHKDQNDIAEQDDKLQKLVKSVKLKTVLHKHQKKKSKTR